MAKTNKTIVIFLIFLILLMQAFLFVNEKIQRNQIAFDEKQHAEESFNVIEEQSIVYNEDVNKLNQNVQSNNIENQVLSYPKISYKSLFGGLYEIPDLIKVNPNYEYITDYKIKDINTAIVITDKNIYLKLNGQLNQISTDGIPSNAYFTSCELAKYDNKYFIFIGTSYSGLFAKSLDDKKFYHFYIGIKRVFYTSEQSLLFETITALYAKGYSLFIGYQSSKGVDILDLKSYYQMRISKNSLYSIIKVPFEFKDSFRQKVERFFEIEDRLYAYTNYGIYIFKDDSFILDTSFEPDMDVVDNEIRGLYVSSFAASSRKKIDQLIDIAKYCNLNAFVVDFKDDYGYLSYGSNLELAKKMKSTRKLIDLEYLLNRAQENDIKIIARVVSFRDPIAYNYENYKFAMWSKSKNCAWSGAKSIEKWIDPYNEEYLNYLIDVAKEIESLGVYEIQFDYVRFPAEGDVSDILFRYNTKNISKNNQIFNFFSKAKENLKVPISADFFGYQCWYKISKHIGQDIYLNSAVLNAVYPMYYPSHFSKGFYAKSINQLESVKLIYKHGVVRAFENSNYQIAVRPWIQAFKLDVKEDFVQYIKNEIEGVLGSGINSYIFWNPGCDYKVLLEVFSNFNR